MIKKKRVAAICKATRRLRLETLTDNTQWIGNGHAFYIMAGVNLMTIEAVASMFDYSEKDMQKISVAENIMQSYADLLAEEYPDEIQIEKPPQRVFIGGSEYLFYETDSQVIFIDEEYLKPIVADDQTTYFMRPVHQSTTPVLCVKKGFLPEAIICGVNFPTKTIKDWMDNMTKIMSSVMAKFEPYDSTAASDDRQYTLDSEEDGDDEG